MSQVIQQIKRWPWNLWSHQISGIIRLEFRKSYLRRRALWLYFLAGAPPLFLMGLVIMLLKGTNPGHFNAPFHEIFHMLYLRLIVFFGCLGIFTYLFRGEVLEKTLHYYFLAPISRHVLTIGKFLAGFLVSCFLFGGSVICSFFLIHLANSIADPSIPWMDARSLGQLTGYLNVILFACLGYGAVFFMIGLIFRSPIIPVILFWGWETVIFLLPPLLKRFSIIFNLNSLAPVPLPLDIGPFAVLATPTPVWVVIPGLLLFTSVVLVLSGQLLRRMEINYCAD